MKNNIFRYLYTLVLILVCPFYLFGLYKSNDGKPSYGKRWKEHFGLTPKLFNPTTERPIWIHCVSVGETISAIPLIKALKEKYPLIPVIITTTTSTGAEQAKKISNIAEHRYMPLDFPFSIKNFIRIIQPQKMLIMETELWPNTIYHVSKAGIPINVINARLSQRSADRYKKFPFVFKLISDGIQTILCQHHSDAEHFKRLGIPENAIKITGSLKFDISIDPITIRAGCKLRLQLGKDRPVWIAASTHDNEEDIILDAHRVILESYPNALLILVPRHPDRFIEVATLCLTKGFNLVKRSEARESNRDYNVYLADTMGEMLTLIEAADVCFMAGSLIGDKVGGHNILEPAILTKPIITGPSYYNFKDIVEGLKYINAIEIVNSSRELSSCLLRHFKTTDETLKKDLLIFMSQHSGAVKKTLNYI